MNVTSVVVDVNESYHLVRSLRQQMGIACWIVIVSLHTPVPIAHDDVEFATTTIFPVVLKPSDVWSHSSCLVPISHGLSWEFKHHFARGVHSCCGVFKVWVICKFFSELRKQNFD